MEKQQEPVSYTHLDVYKRQEENNDNKTQNKVETNIQNENKQENIIQ